MNRIPKDEFPDKREVRKALKKACVPALSMYDYVLKNDHFIMNGAYMVPIEKSTIKELLGSSTKELGSVKKAREVAFAALLEHADILAVNAKALYMFVVVPLAIRPRKRAAA